jgi:hypothetical protein
MRVSMPAVRDVTAVSIIGAWHLGQGGRSGAARPGSSKREFRDMALPFIGRERGETLSHR